MRVRWPEVALREVLTQFKEYVDAPEPREYPKLSVKLHGKGVVLDSPADGATLKMKRHQLARVGQVILSEIWGKKGAIGIVPREGDGALCTSHFFLFDVKHDRVESGWLQAVFRGNYLAPQLEARAFGTTGYAAVRPKDLLSCTLPLPPLFEQHRIVARIESLAAKVEEAVRLLNTTAGETDALQTSHDGRVLSTLEKKHGSEVLDHVMVDAAYGTSVKCSVERAYGAQPILRIPNVATETVSFENLKYAASPPDEKRKLSLQTGDLLVVRTNGSADLVGRCAVVHQLPEPTGFASYLIRIRVDTTRVSAAYVQRVLRQLRNSGELFECARTTAGQYNVSLGRLKRIRIPIPPIAVQQQVVEGIDGVFREVARIRENHGRIRAELAALMPAILDRAFKGGL